MPKFMSIRCAQGTSKLTTDMAAPGESDGASTVMLAIVPVSPRGWPREGVSTATRSRTNLEYGHQAVGI